VNGMRRHPLDGLFAGQPLFIVSTGTSLRRFEFARLDGRITIGINRVVEHYQPTVLHLLDRTAHRTHASALARYGGLVIANEGAAPAGRANTYEVRHNVDTFELQDGATELSTVVGRSFADGFFGGGAGCTALHTAMLLGADPIYLLGYDFYEDNGRHFDEWNTDQNAESLYGTTLDGISHLARQPWVPRIFNCNPSSRLRVFPTVNIDEVLRSAA
jgi:hypothetical protein